MAGHQHNHHDDDQNCLKKAKVIVVMVPLPAQGHLNQLLHLSRLISSYGIPVHYVGTTTHSRQAKLRVHGWDPLTVANIHFHEFATPSFLSPARADPLESFPSHLLPLFFASSNLREPVAKLLRTLSQETRKLIVINDTLMASVVQDVPSIPNAESYTFTCVSAFSIYLFKWAMGAPVPIETEIEKEVPSLESCVTSEFLEFSKTQNDYRSFNSGNIYNTCKVIEKKYLDVLADGQTKEWAIGPFNPVETYKNENRNRPGHACLEWLDRQDPNSVIFVSFGTTTSLSDDQIKELAIGLKQSEQKFIWVLRDADKTDIFSGEDRKAELPEGYEEGVKGRGIVIKDWAPQLEILGHSSTGGFMSHCGWNSCMESISLGVPVAAWPMHSDQPGNALLITKVLKVGLMVRDWAHRLEIVSSLSVENAVKRLMASMEGDKMRKRAAELGSAVRQSVQDGGVTRMELDSFIAHITR